MEGERPIIDRKALPWEDRGASAKEIRKAKKLKKKHPELNIMIPEKHLHLSRQCSLIKKILTRVMFQKPSQ